MEINRKNEPYCKVSFL